MSSPNRNDGRQHVRFSSLSSMALSASMLHVDVDREREICRRHRSLVRVSIQADGHLIFEQTECFCGILTVSQGARLIGVIEALFCVIFAIQIPDFLHNDGHFFYTRAWQGYGRTMFAIALSGIVSCIVAVALLLVGLDRRRPRLLVPHLLWQLTFVTLAGFMIIGVVRLILCNQILLPSAVVLIAFFGLPSLVQLWWFRTVFTCYRLLAANRRFSRRWSEALYRLEATSARTLIDQCYNKGDAVFLDVIDE
uniref:Uncharacterized protein n=1 Tax=Plectus sambesii TaxID=2011161 RepID=A0A914VIW1_9BILA